MIREREPIWGSVLIFIVCCNMLMANAKPIVDGPWWWTAWTLFSVAVVALNVSMSIYRDRIK